MLHENHIKDAYQNKPFAIVSFGVNACIYISFVIAKKLEKEGRWNENLDILVQIIVLF